MESSKEPILDVRDMSIAYHKQRVVEEVSFQIPPGKLVGIIGPNGAGKSTLIKGILEFIPTLSGEVKIAGKPLRQQRKLVGYVPQRGSVDWDFPTTALDVVVMGRYGQIGMMRRVKKEDKALAYAMLEKVGMAPFANRQISQLSGGQQQRVFLARALAQNAQLYFMDEPFVGVDAATEKAIITLLTHLKQEGKTVIVVHHDLQTVQDYFDWVILLNKCLIAIGPTEEVFTMDRLQHTYGGRLTQLSEMGEMAILQGR